MRCVFLTEQWPETEFFFLLQMEFCICLLLTFLGYIPGIIYALYVIVFVDRDEYFDEHRRPLYASYSWSMDLPSFDAVCIYNFIIPSGISMLCLICIQYR